MVLWDGNVVSSAVKNIMAFVKWFSVMSSAIGSKWDAKTLVVL